MPSVSLSLNVPGLPKSNDIVKKFFFLCLKDLKFFLKANLISWNDEDEIIMDDIAGDFFITPFSVKQLSLQETKLICESFEEGHPLGRFMDVDVTDSVDNPVSSGKAKLCFFCHQKPAIECRRENAHELNELRAFMFSKMEAFFEGERKNEICRQLSIFALRAILYEISLTPKPGLVDKFCNGSHPDMNYRTFLNSSSAISHWFTELAHAGFNFPGKDLSEALPIIRNVGLQMEAAMFKSTHNVNTQRGLIFLMGLSLFASAYLYAGQDKFEIELFRKIIMQICKDITSKELENPKQSGKTHGEEIFGRYGIPGARGEAEKGFPMVFDYGLPELLKGWELDDEVLQRAFLSIAAHNNDTNIVFRSDLNVLGNFKALSFEALNHYNTENYTRIIDFCRTENISPGGTADLLTVSIFIYSLIRQNDENGLFFLTTNS
jgi:holo-ACP synthase / triphosphoribosyl-dephospho-CoA synthase